MPPPAASVRKVCCGAVVSCILQNIRARDIVLFCFSRFVPLSAFQLRRTLATMASALQAVFVAVAAIVTIYYSGKGSLVMKKLSESVHGKPGCSPVGNLGNVTLHYFAGRGRAEAIRMMLELGDIPYTEISFESDTWPRYKKEGIESGLYTFGQVPAMETSKGLKLCQSQAILHYIGRATGMECDCDDLHLCEIVALGVEDARSKLSQHLYDPNFSLQDRHTYLTDTLPMWLRHFEKLAPPLVKQDAPYFASDRLTWADVLVFDYLDANIEFSRFDFGTSQLIQVDPLAAFPKLTHFYSHVARIPRMNAFLHSKKRFPFKVPYMPKTPPPVELRE